MSIITEKNLKKAIQSNGELLGVAQGFQEAASESAKILEADITTAEKFGLIDFADDENVKVGRKLLRALKAKLDLPDEDNPMKAMMGGDLDPKQVDFTTMEGNAIARADGKQKGYRTVLKALRQWKDEDDAVKQLDLMVEVSGPALEAVLGWAEFYKEQEEKAAVRLSELKAMSF